MTGESPAAFNFALIAGRSTVFSAVHFVMTPDAAVRAAAIVKSAIAKNAIVQYLTAVSFR